MTDGYVHFPSRERWTREAAQACFRFALHLAEQERCVAATTGEVLYPPEAAREFAQAGERLRKREAPTRAAAELALSQDDVVELRLLGLLVALNSPENKRAWAQDFCLRLAHHAHLNVRGNAVRALGLLVARLGRTGISDLELSLTAIRDAQADPHPYVSRHAELASVVFSVLARHNTAPSQPTIVGPDQGVTL